MRRVLLLWVLLISTAIGNGQVVMLKAVQHRDSLAQTEKEIRVPNWISINRDIVIADYFTFMDSVMVAYDSLVNYDLTEHLLVRANSWIIDTLANTDYYRMIRKDSFVYDQGQLLVLRAGDSLKIPDSLSAKRILKDFKNTYIDINIPAFKLRIYQASKELFTFPIRVGQNRKRYLAMSDRVTDLRTKTGSGKIVRHARNPDFYNPTTGRRFHLTKRDDERTTLMPQIPWIETEIDGVLNGQMIHPTTNPETLGKAYSNGCIGTSEADAWVIYYYAPVETSIHIRYQLTVKDDDGNEIVLEDIYGLSN